MLFLLAVFRARLISITSWSVHDAALYIRKNISNYSSWPAQSTHSQSLNFMIHGASLDVANSMRERGDLTESSGFLYTS